MGGIRVTEGDDNDPIQAWLPVRVIPRDYTVVFVRPRLTGLPKCPMLRQELQRMGTAGQLGRKFLGSLSNAVELEFEIKRRRDAQAQYRVDAKIEMDVSWSESNGPFKQVYYNPASEPVTTQICLDGKSLLLFRRAGWSELPGTVGELRTELSPGRHMMTTSTVTGVILKQNFVEVVRSSLPNEGWRQVSKPVRWFSFLAIRRDSAAKGWQLANANYGIGHRKIV